MSQTPVIITPGTGGASVAAELVGGTSWQQIEVYGGGGSSVLSVNPDGSIKVSVIGSPTFGASIIGTVPVTGSFAVSSASVVQQGTWSVSVVGATLSGNPSISGTVNVGNLPTTQNVSGSVVATQGTTPWTISSVYGNVSGSIAGTYSNSNVASTVTGVAVMFKQNVSSSIMTEVSPTFPLPVTFGATANQSVSGTVGSSIIGQLPAGTAVLGSVATLQGTVPWIISSVYGNVSGSVVAFQGTSPWIETFSNSSIIAIAAGSVVSIPTGSTIAVLQSSSIITVQGGTRTTSIVGGASVFQAGTWQVSVAGTYAVGSASIVSALGFLELGVRNDTLASIYAANAQYTPFTVGPVGEVISANAPVNQWFQSTGSCFTGVFQPVTASVSAQYTYATAIQVTNASANNAYLSFSGAGIGSTVGSIIAYTVAPANGGSNIYFPNGLKSGISNPLQASVNAVASVFIAVQGFTSKT